MHMHTHTHKYVHKHTCIFSICAQIFEVDINSFTASMQIYMFTAS
jgi:hypothetical protein